MYYLASKSMIRVCISDGTILLQESEHKTYLYFCRFVVLPILIFFHGAVTIT